MLKRKNLLTNWGEIKNKKREREFFEDEIAHSLMYIRPLSLIIGFLYFLFIIPDYFLINNAYIFRFILINRTLMLILVLVLYFKLPSLVEAHVYNRWITVCEFLFVSSFLSIYALYESPDLLIQSWGAILLILAVHIVPNRWVYMVCVSVYVYLGFFIITFYVMPAFNIQELSASGVYILIILLFSGITTWRINCYKRIQYLYNRRISFFSTYDSLTKLYNRYKFEGELQKAISLAKRYHMPFSVIFYDIDDFKKINDQYGHPKGDRILVTKAHLVKKQIRECDIYVRWGGEEFIIILPNTELKEALNVARKIKELITEYPFETGNITCSFGVTSYRENDDRHSIIKRVDRFLYIAKQNGKNRIVSEDF